MAPVLDEDPVQLERLAEDGPPWDKVQGEGTRVFLLLFWSRIEFEKMALS